jgi:hypothetical protein
MFNTKGEIRSEIPTRLVFDTIQPPHLVRIWRSTIILQNSEVTHRTEYVVESLPDITDDPGEMYSGTISIDDADPTAQMFFVFEPTIGDPVDEITIWLNGVRNAKK